MLAQPSQSAILSQYKRVVAGYAFVFLKFNWNGEDGTIMEIKRGRHRLLRRQGHALWIFSLDKQADSFELEGNQPVRVADLNGDGVKDVVIQEWSGGAHCCYTYDIYSLFPDKLRNIWHMNAGDGHLSIETPEKGPAVLVVQDASFAYWATSFSEAPMPNVYLRWTNGAFRMVATRMRKSVDPQKFKQCAADPNSAQSLRYFVELVYQGHADQALGLLDKMQPQERREFLKGFNEYFRKSAFFTQISNLNDPKAIARLRSN